MGNKVEIKKLEKVRDNLEVRRMEKDEEIEDLKDKDYLKEVVGKIWEGSDSIEEIEEENGIKDVE